MCLSGLGSEVPLHCDIPRRFSQQPLLSHSPGITALLAAPPAAAAAAAAAHTGGRRTGKTDTGDHAQCAGWTENTL